ncbi:hypothetical protein [Haloarcula amylovorans]|uniref:hypothetical protein n=1 Tax=Haloarcula amylovorans TaxID=2562280 RepID=UPI0010764F6F|nr:hypothetical protein [Halomicroarcula amylolytica]
MNDQHNVTFDEFGLDHGDRVRVDWTEGVGPLEEVIGTISGISTSAGDMIVAVEADDNQYPDGSIYGGTHDCAPDWVTPLHE